MHMFNFLVSQFILLLFFLTVDVFFCVYVCVDVLCFVLCPPFPCSTDSTSAFLQVFMSWTNQRRTRANTVGSPDPYTRNGDLYPAGKCSIPQGESSDRVCSMICIALYHGLQGPAIFIIVITHHTCRLVCCLFICLFIIPSASFPHLSSFLFFLSGLLFFFCSCS